MLRHLRTCRSCKPGSVPGANPGPLSFIWDGSLLPPQATYPPALDEQPLIAGIHGLATHEMYCPKRIATFAVGSYPAFSPLPPTNRGRYFFCGTGLPAEYGPRYPSFQKDSLLCAVRTFLNGPGANSFDRRDCPQPTHLYGMVNIAIPLKYTRGIGAFLPTFSPLRGKNSPET